LVPAGGLLGSVDVDLFAEGLEFVGLREYLDALAEVFFTESDLDAVFLDGVGGIALAVVTAHTHGYDPDRV
jgi:hypothetical protein